MGTSRIAQDVFGTTAAGRNVDRFTLHGPDGMTLRLIGFGATVAELHVPDRDGRPADVVLGFDELSSYETCSPYFGSTVGRVAFRIPYGRFELGGQSHQLTANDGPHHLHGGTGGFSWALWDAEPLETDDGPAVRFSYRSPDGDQGYPGQVDATVVYTLTGAGEMRVEFAATCDRPTPVDMTHHSYFNLAGAGSGDVLGHVLHIEADTYSETDEETIPTGALAPVAGTPFDFRRPTPIGARIDELPRHGGGYDLAYLRSARVSDPAGSLVHTRSARVSDPAETHDRQVSPPLPTRETFGPGHVRGRETRAQLAHVATLEEPSCGRIMQVHTDAPALIFYTGNYLDGSLRGKRGTVYQKHFGLTLETGHLPDAVHHADFPSVILHPGRTYRQTCVYRFLTR